MTRPRMFVELLQVPFISKSREQEDRAAPQRPDPRWQHCPGRSAQSCIVALLPAPGWVESSW